MSDIQAQQPEIGQSPLHPKPTYRTGTKRQILSTLMFAISSCRKARRSLVAQQTTR
jgi:hypothetical protein